MKQALYTLIVTFLQSLNANITKVRIQSHTWTKDRKGNTIVDKQGHVDLRAVKTSISQLLSVMEEDSAGIEVSTCDPALMEQCREIVEKVIEIKRIGEQFHAAELPSYTGRVNGQQVQFTGYKIGSKPVDVDTVLGELNAL